MSPSPRLPLLVVVLAATALSAGQAEACSCSFAMHFVHPQDGDENVPRQPLVVLFSNRSWDPQDTRLMDVAGDEVAVSIETYGYLVHVLRPLEPLAASAEYRVVLDKWWNHQEITFRTGEALTAPAPQYDGLEQFEAQSVPSRDLTCGDTCVVLVDDHLHRQFVSPQPGEDAVLSLLEIRREGESEPVATVPGVHTRWGLVGGGQPSFFCGIHAAALREPAPGRYCARMLAFGPSGATTGSEREVCSEPVVCREVTDCYDPNPVWDCTPLPEEDPPPEPEGGCACGDTSSGALLGLAWLVARRRARSEPRA